MAPGNSNVFPPRTKSSELECNCLEFILPIDVEDASASSNSSSGYGTKKLDDGRIVRVNYEKLLRNEATKRVLLQRTVGAYEGTIESLRTKLTAATLEAETTTRATMEAEKAKIHATMEAETAKMDATTEVDNAKAEAQQTRFELAEARDALATVRNENESLRRAAAEAASTATMAEEARISMEQEADNKLRMAEMARKLAMEGAKKAKADWEAAERLEGEIETLRLEATDARESNARLEAECEALRVAGSEKDVQISDLEAAASSAASADDDAARSAAEEANGLRDEVALLTRRLEDCATEAQTVVAKLNDAESQLAESRGGQQRNDDAAEARRHADDALAAAHESGITSLRTLIDERDARIVELTAAVESSEEALEEVDALRGTVASLRYELEARADEQGEGLLEAVELPPSKQVEEQRDDAAIATVRAENEALRSETAELRTDFENLRRESEEHSQTAAAEAQKAQTVMAERDALAIESQSLSHEISTLRHRIDDLSSERDAAIASRDGQTAELFGLRADLDAKEVENRSLKERTSLLQIEMNTSRARIQSALTEAEASKREKEEAEQTAHCRIEEMEREREVLALDLDDYRSRLEGERTKNSKVIATMDRDRLQVEDRVRILETQLRETATKLERVAASEVEMERLAAEVEELTGEMERKSVECDEFESSVLELRAEVDAAEAKVRKALKKNEELLESDDALRADLNDMEQKCAGVETQVAEVEARWRYSEAVNAELLADKAEVDAKLEYEEAVASELRQQKQQQKAEGSANEEGLINAAMIMDAELTSLRSDLAQKTASYNDIVAKYDKLRGEVLNNGTEKASLRNNLAKKTTECQEILGRYEKLRKEVLNVEGKLGHATSSPKKESAKDKEVARLEDEVARLTGEIHSLTERSRALSEENACLVRDKSDIATSLQARATALEARATDAEHGNQILDAERAALNSREERSVQERADLRQNIEALQDTVGVLEKSNTEMEEQMFGMSIDANDADRLGAENATLRQDLEQLRSNSKNVSEEVEVLRSRADEAAVEEEEDTLKYKSMYQDMFGGGSIDTSNDNHGINGKAAFGSEERQRLLTRIAELEEQQHRSSNTTITTANDISDTNNNHVNELRDELTSLHEEKEQIDFDNEELLVQLALMQQSRVEEEEELDELRERVEDLEEECRGLRTRLEGGGEGQQGPMDITFMNGGTTNAENAVRDELKRTNDDLQAENTALQEDISSLNQEKTLLLEKLDEASLRNTESDPLSIEYEKYQAVQVELTLARSRLDVLESQLAEKDRNIAVIQAEREACTSERDEDVSRLEKERSSLETDLEESARTITEKENEIGGLAAQLESLRNRIDEESKEYDPEYDTDGEEESVGVDQVSVDDNNDNNGDDADDELRYQIYALAQALERSELQRADAIERVVKERKSNADSLRRIGESVKRFYSTVSCSDTA